MENSIRIFNQYVKDIRFLIIVFFLFRLIGVTNAPLEKGHNWRQTTVTMAARNFLEIDNNILYPRIDFAGEKTGITGMEFPVLNYSIYWVSKIFGYQHWYGRLINLIVSSFGLFFFFKIIRKYFDKSVAFNATLILLFSLWFSFSRKIMPDTFSMSFIIAGMYYGTNYLDKLEGKQPILQLLLYLILTMLGVLSKLPSGYLPIIFILFYLDKNIVIQRKAIFAFVSIIALAPAVWWYFSWVPHLVETYGFWHFFMGSDLLVGIQEIINHLPLTLSRFYADALKYIGFGMFLLGIFYAIRTQNKRLLAVGALGFFSFSLIVFKSGYTFAHHNYYVIPFVPIMALFAGYGVAQIKNKKLALLIIFAIGLEGVLGQMHDFKIKEKDKGLLQLEADLDEFSSQDDLILINSTDYPTPMYFAHRKGWITYNEQIKNKVYRQSLQEHGLKYIVILKRSFGTVIPLDLPIMIENEDYTIYGLKTKEDE